jgi:hypothetical protein
LTEADGSYEANPIAYIDTVLRYYLHIDPRPLTDEEWAQAYAQLIDIRNKEAGK